VPPEERGKLGREVDSRLMSFTRELDLETKSGGSHVI